MRSCGPLGLVILLLLPTARAADPQPYRVQFAKVEDSALNATLQSTSQLSGLRKSAPVGPFALIGRARADTDLLKTVLESYGYYQGSVSITIDNLTLSDPSLGEELTNRSGKDEAVVNVAFTLGPLFHLGKIELTGDVPPKAAAAETTRPPASRLLRCTHSLGKNSSEMSARRTIRPQTGPPIPQ